MLLKIDLHTPKMTFLLFQFLFFSVKHQCESDVQIYWRVPLKGAENLLLVRLQIAICSPTTYKFNLPLVWRQKIGFLSLGNDLVQFPLSEVLPEAFLRAVHDHYLSVVSDNNLALDLVFHLAVVV